MTTRSESIVIEAFEQAGWAVAQNGWPDLLALKDGQLRFIEVKGTCRDKVSVRQSRIFRALELIGIEVEVIPTRCICRRDCLQPVPF